MSVCTGPAGTVEQQICLATEAAEKAAVAATKLAERASTLTEIAALVGALAGLAIPIAIVAIVWRLWPDLHQMLKDGRLSLKVGDFEVKTEKAINEGKVKVKLLGRDGEIELEMTLPEAIKQLNQAANSNAEKIAANEQALTELARLHPAKPPKLKEAMVRRARSILWVDDHPENNALLVSQLRGRGHSIVQVTSTDAALKRIDRGEAFDLVISDLGRAGDRLAGKTLAAALAAQVPDLPVIIYASPRALGFRDELLAAGAKLVTVAPSDVYRFIDNPQAG